MTHPDRTTAGPPSAGSPAPAVPYIGLSWSVWAISVLCYSPTFEQHIQDVREVLAILRQEKLYVKALKWEFRRRVLGFLGDLVSGESVADDPRKVSEVRDWPVPTFNVDLCRFISLRVCNYHRRVVDGHADISPPLTHFCCPHAPWAWGPKEEPSIERWERCLTTAPALRTRAFDSRRRHSTLTTDESEVANLAVLIQPDDDGVHHHPVAYESGKLTLVKKAYPAYVPEFLVVVHALCVFRHYYLGSGAARRPVGLHAQHRQPGGDVAQHQARS